MSCDWTQVFGERNVLSRISRDSELISCCVTITKTAFRDTILAADCCEAHPISAWRLLLRQQTSQSTILVAYTGR